jgi:DNA polymerase (family X)
VKLHDQFQEIRDLNRQYPGIRILTGMEVDIKANGMLDIPDELLAEMDVVIASVHSSLNQSEEQITQRILKAVEHPQVNIIGHLTGRLLGDREPSAVNVEKVFQAAVQNHTALEINAMPSRLDLKDTHIYQAREMGVKLVINTDSHRPEHLEYMRFGVGIARRGWCQSQDILNTFPLEKFLDFLKNKK